MGLLSVVSCTEITCSHKSSREKEGRFLMKIRIRKRQQMELLVQYIFILPFLFFFLMDLCQFPSVVKYTVDVVWLLLLAAMLLNRVRFSNPQAKKILKIVGAFFLLTLVGLILEYQSVLYYLWGIRNNARFFVFFAACILFLSATGAQECLRLMDRVFYINLAVTLFQFFAMEKRGDHLGGIFGVETGANGYTNIFLLIVVTWHMLQYLNEREALKSCLTKCVLTLLIAALAELKFLYIEFVVVIIMGMFVTHRFARKLWIALGGLTGAYFGILLMQILFPNFANWFTLQRIWETATSARGYTSSGDMNRLTAIPMVWNGFLDTPLRKCFGLGLGNCDTSNFEFLVTPFSVRYTDLHYVFFSSAFMLLETGAAGLMVYLLFFAAIYVYARQRERQKEADPVYCQMACIMAAMSVLLIIYNSSMRTEAAYMVYFVLALPFINAQQKTHVPKEVSTFA